MKVYLAGPMTAASDLEQEWRLEAKRVLEFDGVQALLPYKMQSYQDEYHIDAYEAEFVLTYRDFVSCTECDVVIANFKGAQDVSIGTCIELGWASAKDKIIITVLPAGERNPHANHPMIESVTTIRCDSLGQAVRIVLAMNAKRLVEAV